METLTLALMDTEVYVAVVYEQPTNWQPIIQHWFEYVAKEWSRFQPNNELSVINDLSIGETLVIQPPLYDCLQLAHTYYEKTNGVFSPYMKQQLVAQGYDETFYNLSGASHTLPKIDKSALAFLGKQTIQKVSHAQIDLGGIAKGFAAHYAAELLQSLGKTKHGLVDVGGDMQMWSHDDKVWTIGIANPFDAKQTLATIPLQNGAVATSSRVKRSWANGLKNHLLNGQTGACYAGDLLQVTAVANTAYLAEVAAKTSFFTADTKHYFPQIYRYIVQPNEHGWL